MMPIKCIFKTKLTCVVVYLKKYLLTKKCIIYIKTDHERKERRIGGADGPLICVLFYGKGRISQVEVKKL